MPARTATARWEGGLQQGKGTVRLGSGAFEGQYSFSSRFEEGTGTNPEELIGAGHAPTAVDTTARVHLERVESGFRIPRIELDCTANVPGIDDGAFQEQAEAAKANCPVSKALAGVDIQLDARLAG